MKKWRVELIAQLQAPLAASETVSRFDAEVPVCAHLGAFSALTLDVLRVLLAVFFVVAGRNHFCNPEPYLQIMPPMLPYPRELVAISGVFEILGGVGVLVQPTRKLAAWGLVALLVAVFPANIYSAFHGFKLDGKDVPQWILWARLPLQLPLIWWAYSVSKD